MAVLQKPQIELRSELFRAEWITRAEPEKLPRRKRRVVAVMPAYNAERTLAATLADMPAGCVDEIILVDDGSRTEPSRWPATWA
jgi:hypothetical protein